MLREKCSTFFSNLQLKTNKKNCRSSRDSLPLPQFFANSSSLFLSIIRTSLFRDQFHKEQPLRISALCESYSSSASTSAAAISSMAIPSSFNCASSTTSGALVIRQEASFTFGKAITSRILSPCTSSITRRSRP